MNDIEHPFKGYLGSFAAFKDSFLSWNI